MLRALAKQLVSQGRHVWESVVQRGETRIKTRDFKKLDPQHGPAPQPRPLLRWTDVQLSQQSKSWIHGISGSSRHSLVAQLRRRVDNSINNEGLAEASRFFNRSWGQYAGRRLLSLYAFVGLGVKAGSQHFDFSEEQFDHICTEIKDVMNNLPSIEISNTSKCMKLSSLELGPLIDKGCNSAVYRACFKEEEIDQHAFYECATSASEDLDGDFVILSEEELTTTESYEDGDWSTGSDITIISESETEDADSMDNNMDINYDLAVKMMFNYDVESNANAIIHAMQNEAVPAKVLNISEDDDDWERGIHVRKKKLKYHPNIVEIWGMFVDDIPDLPDSLMEYPDALPQRLNPDGFGHNKTMFLIMKRYDLTLREYLRSYKPTLTESILLLTQLLEACAHLRSENVAHRDLKSDNIFICLKDGSPHLVIGDFGCCLADDNIGLQLPYFTEYVDKGGNCTLMAPEILCKDPGFGVYLDYSKADLWAVGALAYEIFGGENPFYHSSGNAKKLNSKTYQDEELPDLPVYVPSDIQRLIKCILKRDPKQRPTPAVAANILHIHLWLPRLLNDTMAEKLEVMRWLLVQTAVVVIKKLKDSESPCDTLRECFLSRISMEELMDATAFLLHE